MEQQDTGKTKFSFLSELNKNKGKIFGVVVATTLASFTGGVTLPIIAAYLAAKVTKNVAVGYSEVNNKGKVAGVINSINRVLKPFKNIKTGIINAVNRVLQPFKDIKTSIGDTWQTIKNNPGKTFGVLAIGAVTGGLGIVVLATIAAGVAKVGVDVYKQHKTRVAVRGAAAAELKFTQEKSFKINEQKVPDIENNKKTESLKERMAIQDTKFSLDKGREKMARLQKNTPVSQNVTAAQNFSQGNNKQLSSKSNFR